MFAVEYEHRFEAAHRLPTHPGKCRNLHGHSYRLVIQVTSPGLDNQGMVVDFALLKQTIGQWIDENWDHNTILHKDDPLAVMPEAVFGRRPCTLNVMPTAEELARIVYQTAKALLRTAAPHMQVSYVRLYETEKCSACYMEL